MPRTFTDQNRAYLIQLHGEETSLRDIAKLMGFSVGTISKHAKLAGLAFDRTQTSLATRARQIDLLEARQLLAQKMLLVASDLMDTIDKPYLVYNFGGKDNTYEEHTLPKAPTDAQRSIVTTAAIAFDKATRILEKDNGGLDDAVGVIDALAGNMQAAADLLRAQDETPTDGS